jgi:hypothetical protein
MTLSQTRVMAVLSAAVSLLLECWYVSPHAIAADRIVLRNLKVISDRTVAAFDVDSVRLDNGTSFSWDEIEKASVAADKQSAFDAHLRELGEHLYRIRQRLGTGDYAGLLPHAEAIYGRYADRASDSAYMVIQAVMWGRLAVGRREASLEPYLRCLVYLHSRPASKVQLPGDRRLRFDAATGMTPELMPVWFDAEAARGELPHVYRRIGEMARPRPGGVYVYYVTMALAAGERELADKVIDAGAIPAAPAALAELRGIIDAQREIMAGQPGAATSVLATAGDRISAANRPLALYWLGTSRTAGGDGDERRRGALDLLRIPALHGRESPELAAAALFRVMNLLADSGDSRGSVAVRRELLERYGQTYYAAHVRGESAPATANEEKP